MQFASSRNSRGHRLLASVRLCTCAGLIAALSSAQASAAGFMVRENSAAGIGTVFAGNGSRADTPATAFNNPAGMMRLTGTEVELGIATIIPSLKFHGSATAMGGPVSGTNGDDAGRVVFVPNLYWTFALSDRWKGGIAITAPFGLGVAYDSPWVGRYLGIKTSALAADINPNIAYRLTPALSIGAGVSAQYLKLDTSSALAQFVIFGPGAPDALYRFNAHDWAFGYNLGALLELDGGARIGLTYRSQIDHRIKGDLDFTGTNPVLGLVSGAAAADVHLPATTGLSITEDLSPDLSLSADIQFTQWSVFKRVVIESGNPPFPNEEHYRDSWLISVGGVYRLNDIWSLRAGLGWDQTPITDAFRAVNLPDADRYLVGAGFGYKLSDAATLDGAYEHSFASEHASMNNSFNNTDPITHAVVLNGKYNVAVDIVALSVRYKY
jgi:long-chain fatty acid transport protein